MTPDIKENSLRMQSAHTRLRFPGTRKLHIAARVALDLDSVEGYCCRVYEGSSVTRSGDFLDFGQVFKAFGNN